MKFKQSLGDVSDRLYREPSFALDKIGLYTRIGEEGSGNEAKEMALLDGAVDFQLGCPKSTLLDRGFGRLEEGG
jgi:hypothetical protein